MAPPPRKRSKTTERPEEITFDNSARAEYLTGFHKRKQARIKHAQEQAVKREKEERVAQRKELRQQRKEDLERHVAEVNRMLKEANPDLQSSSDDEGDEGGEWNGIEEGGEEQKHEDVVDREEEYVDEDKYTTVTVETVDIDRDGFKKRPAGDEDDEEDGEDEDVEGRDATNEAGGEADAKKANGKRVWTKERPKTDKPKKKKFRYESKAERKVTRDKQKAKSRTQAQARKAKGK
ncbi:protein required for cell viability rrp17 [Diplodia corticola]|uniref:Protein required for cell viability rrp17 n=1 Tax=Diplodia corticola TaxID=236234 RepID=A0A1J9QVL1_9PEZI|nr:protein required for cell viability rrp17 [Diplodia corticola]OJD32425.1 protein required for cell viability rrp17 [Diplodia corticola]